MAAASSSGAVPLHAPGPGEGVIALDLSGSPGGRPIPQNSMSVHYDACKNRWFLLNAELQEVQRIINPPKFDWEIKVDSQGRAFIFSGKDESQWCAHITRTYLAEFYIDFAIFLNCFQIKQCF